LVNVKDPPLAPVIFTAPIFMVRVPEFLTVKALLGLLTPAYMHVPLVLGDDGERLAKRHGAVTMSDLAATGVGPDEVRARLLSEMEAWFPYGKS